MVDTAPAQLGFDLSGSRIRPIAAVLGAVWSPAVECVRFFSLPFLDLCRRAFAGAFMQKLIDHLICALRIILSHQRPLFTSAVSEDLAKSRA